MGRAQAPTASPGGMGCDGNQLGSSGVSGESSPALLAPESIAGLHCRTTQDEGLRGPARIWGFPGGASGKESSCQCRSCKRLKFDPWAGKIPWRRVWQPTLVFKLGKFHRQRSLAVYCPWVTKTQTQLKRLGTHAFLAIGYFSVLIKCILKVLFCLC